MSFGERARRSLCEKAGTHPDASDSQSLDIIELGGYPSQVTCSSPVGVAEGGLGGGRRKRKMVEE